MLHCNLTGLNHATTVNPSSEELRLCWSNKLCVRETGGQCEVKPQRKETVQSRPIFSIHFSLTALLFVYISHWQCTLHLQLKYAGLAGVFRHCLHYFISRHSCQSLGGHVLCKALKNKHCAEGLKKVACSYRTTRDAFKGSFPGTYFPHIPLVAFSHAVLVLQYWCRFWRY